MLQTYINNGTQCALICLNGGQCAYVDDNSAPYCACRKPYHGPTCEYKSMCLPACQNGGTCEVTETGTYCRCHHDFEGPACDNIRRIQTEKQMNKGNYGALWIATIVIILVLVTIAFAAIYIFKKRRLFSHERLQENDFTNPTYQDRDAEPFTLDADRVSIVYYINNKNLFF